MKHFFNIEELIEFDQTITPKEIQAKLLNEFEINISIVTIQKAIKNWASH
jgi:hypothetical protein